MGAHVRLWDGSGSSVLWLQTEDLSIFMVVVLWGFHGDTVHCGIQLRVCSPAKVSQSSMQHSDTSWIRAPWLDKCNLILAGRKVSQVGHIEVLNLRFQLNPWYCGRDSLWVISFANGRQSSAQHPNTSWIGAPWFNMCNLVIACRWGAHNRHHIRRECGLFHCGFHIQVNTLHGDKMDKQCADLLVYIEVFIHIHTYMRCSLA